MPTTSSSWLRASPSGDRLQVLLVDTSTHNRHDALDYYRQRALVPPQYDDQLDALNARVVITNYHAFEPRVLSGNKRSPFDGKLDPTGKKRELNCIHGRVDALNCSVCFRLFPWLNCFCP